MISIYLSNVTISSKIILDQDYFCIEVFLERQGAEIRSESDFITSVCRVGDCDLKEDDHKKRRRTFSGEEDYIFPLTLLKEGVNRMRNTQLIVKN